jgi:hypothetical protein
MPTTGEDKVGIGLSEIQHSFFNDNKIGCVAWNNSNLVIKNIHF